MFLLMRSEVPERDHVQSNLVRGHLLDLYRTDHQRTRIADFVSLTVSRSRLALSFRHVRQVSSRLCPLRSCEL